MADKIKITVEFIMPVDGEDDTMGKQIDRLRDSLQQRLYDDDGNDGTFEIVSVVPTDEFHGAIRPIPQPPRNETPEQKAARAHEARAAGNHNLALLIMAGQA